MEKLNKSQKRFKECILKLDHWNEVFNEEESNYSSKMVDFWDEKLIQVLKQLTVAEGQFVIEVMFGDNDTIHLVDCMQYDGDIEFYCM